MQQVNANTNSKAQTQVGAKEAEAKAKVIPASTGKQVGQLVGMCFVALGLGVATDGFAVGNTASVAVGLVIAAVGATVTLCVHAFAK